MQLLFFLQPKAGKCQCIMVQRSTISCISLPRLRRRFHNQLALHTLLSGLWKLHVAFKSISAISAWAFHEAFLYNSSARTRRQLNNACSLPFHFIRRERITHEFRFSSQTSSIYMIKMHWLEFSSEFMKKTPESCEFWALFLNKLNEPVILEKVDQSCMPKLMSEKNLRKLKGDVGRNMCLCDFNDTWAWPHFQLLNNFAVRYSWLEVEAY